MDKKYASIYDVKSVDDEQRIIEFIATKEIVDYTNEIIKVDGLDINGIKKNKSFLWSHKMTDPPVGKVLSVKKDGNKLIGRAQMTSEEEYPFGYTIYKLIKGGYINNVSIGYKPDYSTATYKDTKDGNVRVINNSNLLEVSAVNVGANRAAVMTSVKSFEDIATKAFDENVIDQNELEEVYNILKGHEEEIIEEEDKVKNVVDKANEYIQKIEALKQKVKELELQLEENEEEDIYESIFKEYGLESREDKLNRLLEGLK